MLTKVSSIHGLFSGVGSKLPASSRRSSILSAVSLVILPSFMIPPISRFKTCSISVLFALSTLNSFIMSRFVFAALRRLRPSIAFSSSSSRFAASLLHRSSAR